MIDKPEAMLTAEAQAVKDAYAALNRGDVDGFVQCFDANIERIEPASPADQGIFRGRDAVRAHVAFHRARWAEGTCEPRRFLVTGDKVVVLAHVHVRLCDEQDWREGDVTDVFVFRAGKAILFRTFFDRAEGLRFAGLTDADAE